MVFKLVLWATLVFFPYGSQLQVGTALLLCVGRLALHAQFEPYRMMTDNAFDYVTLIITALFGLGGIMLQSMGKSKDLAIIKGDKRATAAIESSIEVVELVLYIMVVTVFVIFAIFWLHSVWQKRAKISSVLQSVKERVITQCPCCLRCVRRWCPSCCCGCARSGRRRIRAIPSPASASSSSVMDVEMMPCETNGPLGGGGGLIHSNPLYFQRTSSQRRTGTAPPRMIPNLAQDGEDAEGTGEAKTASPRAVAQDVAGIEAARQHQGTGEGRRRRDTVNPTYSESAQMVELNNRTGRHTALKRRMIRSSSAADGGGGEGVSGDGEGKGDSGVASGKVASGKVASWCVDDLDDVGLDDDVLDAQSTTASGAVGSHIGSGVSASDSVDQAQRALRLTLTERPSPSSASAPEACVDRSQRTASVAL